MSIAYTTAHSTQAFTPLARMAAFHPSLLLVSVTSKGRSGLKCDAAEHVPVVGIVDDPGHVLAQSRWFMGTRARLASSPLQLGPFGMAYIRADNARVGDHGTRSAFDVVPTLIDLLGNPADRRLSGTSLLSNQFDKAAELRPAV